MLREANLEKSKSKVAEHTDRVREENVKKAIKLLELKERRATKIYWATLFADVTACAAYAISNLLESELSDVLSYSVMLLTGALGFCAYRGASINSKCEKLKTINDNIR